MTANELRQHLNDTYSIIEWPKTLEVDAETYGNVCATVIEQVKKDVSLFFIWEDPHAHLIAIAIGDHGGIMFKNVELILKT